MKDNSTSSTSHLIVDTIAFHRLFMYELEKNKRHKTDPCSTLKKTEKKIRRCIIPLSQTNTKLTKNDILGFILVALRLRK